jgi:hypothetical protein
MMRVPRSIWSRRGTTIDGRLHDFGLGRKKKGDGAKSRDNDCDYDRCTQPIGSVLGQAVPYVLPILSGLNQFRFFDLPPVLVAPAWFVDRISGLAPFLAPLIEPATFACHIDGLVRIVQRRKIAQRAPALLILTNLRFWQQPAQQNVVPNLRRREWSARGIVYLDVPQAMSAHFPCCPSRSRHRNVVIGQARVFSSRRPRSSADKFPLLPG